MAGNTLLNTSMLTAESLRILANTMAFGNTVDRQWDDQFARPGMKIGSTVNIRVANRFLVNNGPALNVRPIVETQRPLTITDQFHVDFEFDEASLVLDIDQFSNRYVKPAASQLAARIDYELAKQYINVYNSTGTPGTAPATELALLDPNTLLTEYGCPTEDRTAIITPRASAALVNGFKGNFNPANVISAQFMKGEVANNILGYRQILTSQSVASHLCGSRVASATSTVSATMTTQGSSTITISGTTGQTVNKGDVFTIAGVYNVNPQTRESTGQLKQFVCTETITAASSAYTGLKFSPAIYTSTEAAATVNAFPQATAAVTFVGTASTSYKQHMVFHKNAIVCVSPALMTPRDVADSAALTVDGLSARMLTQYQIGTDARPTRIDTLFGATVIQPEWAVRMWGEVG